LLGAVAKSNFSGCRYREPVYRTLRELAMSYFNIYFNLAANAPCVVIHNRSISRVSMIAIG